ncbi:MAG: tetratricopeptide repeat protein [Verrucomicrobiota bacterium]
MTRRSTFPAALVLVAAIFAAYANSIDAPFVFDDPLAIVENPTIRQLWPLTDVLLPPRGEGLSVEGRPVLNLTLALNYAVGGTAVRGYHLVNIAIHALAALTLLGLARRAFTLPRLRTRFGAAALPLATLISLLWALHPLQTESVTYVIQRAESLVGLFYLLTLYCFVRAAEHRVVRGEEQKQGGERGAARSGECGTEHATSRSAERSEEFGKERAAQRGAKQAEKMPSSAGGADDARYAWSNWSTLAVLACLIGMATKEVMVSAPLLVLLFDRAFISGTFRAAWRARGGLHTALFATWLLLGALVLSTGTRGGTAGFGIDVTPWKYALTQFEAVTRYVWLSFWPEPLIFDYGVAWTQGTADVLPYALALLTLIGATIVAWWRAPGAAWLGILFFAVLSPTSSIVPGNRQTLAEHRMYLPLATVVTLVVCGAHLAARTPTRRRGLFVVGTIVALGLGVLTVRRNRDYATELRLYEDTVAKRPNNGFARYNLGKVYAEAGRHDAAVTEYEHSLRLMPRVSHTHFNLANSLAALGRTATAREQYETALHLDPKYAKSHFNLGNLELALGRKAEAAEHFRAAIALEPKNIEARTNLGGVLLELGQLDGAREQLEQAVKLQPTSVEARFALGNLALLQSRWSDAVKEFEAVLAARPELSLAKERLELARTRSRAAVERGDRK